MGILAMILLHLILVFLPAKLPTYIFVFPVTMSLLMVLLIAPELETGWKYRVVDVPPWKYLLRIPPPIARVNVQERGDSCFLTVDFGASVRGLRVYPGLLYADREYTHFYPSGMDCDWSGRRLEVEIPRAPAIVLREFVLLPAVRMCWKGKFYYLSPLGSNYRIDLKDKRFQIWKNVVVAMEKDGGFIFRLLEGDCDRCVLLVSFTLGMPEKEVTASSIVGSLRSGGRDSTITWKPGKRKYVLLFREEDVWELEEGIYSIPTEGAVLQTQEGKFSVESNVVVEVSHFGQLTRRYETPVYSVTH